MKKAIIVFIVFFGIIFSGCATVVNTFSSNEKKDKRLHIISNPSEAIIIFYDKMGNKISESITPVKIMIPSGCSYIEISKEDYLPEKVIIENRKINPWYWINFIPFVAGAGMASISYGNFNTYDHELDIINSEINYWNGRQGEIIFSQEEINRRNEVLRRRDEIINRRDDVKIRKILFYSGISIGVTGSIGLIIDPVLKNTLKGPPPIYVALKMTQEKEAELRLEAEERIRLEFENAEAERKAAEERMLAEAAAIEQLKNPNNLDRTQYSRVDVSDFSFDIVSGRLPIGSKVSFISSFLIRPTGTNYNFKYVDLGITMISNNNFVRHMERYHFESYLQDGRIVNQRDVTIYVTVQQAGQFGRCSIDIIDW